MRQMRDTRKPEPALNWGIAYLLFISAIGLLYLEGRATITPVEHKAALLGILLLFFVLLWVWLNVEERKWR